MFPPGTRGRARGLPYTMDAFMLGMGMLGESGWDPGDTAEPLWTIHPAGSPTSWASCLTSLNLGFLSVNEDNRPLCKAFVTIE